MSRSHTAKRARPNRGRAVTAVIAALLAVAPVGGAAAQQDLRSPDTVDAARAAGNRPDVVPPPSSIAASAGEAYQDLRSPDARDAAVVSEAAAYQDLYSSDARDAGRTIAFVSPAAAPAGDSADWKTIGIVAGGVLVVVALSMVALVSRRRGTTQKAPTAIAPS